MSAGELRRAFAELVAAGQPRAVIDAFATVERERFLGDPPWLIGSLADPAVPYLATPDADLAHVYRDNVIALVPDKQLNNGLPSAHARWLAAAAIAPGDHVLHVGAGTGYYTAILAELTGPAGRVLGYELEAALVERARTALATRPWASVRLGDGGAPDGTFDAIYVSCGATHARDEWLAALRPGGRLVVPLTLHVPQVPHGVGVMLAMTRAGERWPARVVTPVGFYDCAGARDEAAAAQVRGLVAHAAEPLAIARAPHERGAACLLHHGAFCVQRA